MKIVADECVDQPIVNRLRNDGHTVIAISERFPAVDDETVLRMADRLLDVLLTTDKDFGELVYRTGRSHSGIVLIRLSGVENSVKAELVSEAFRDHGGEFPGAFSVISATSLRVRRTI